MHNRTSGATALTYTSSLVASSPNESSNSNTEDSTRLEQSTEVFGSWTASRPMGSAVTTSTCLPLVVSRSNSGRLRTITATRGADVDASVASVSSSSLDDGETDSSNVARSAATIREKRTSSSVIDCAADCLRSSWSDAFSCNARSLLASRRWAMSSTWTAHDDFIGVIVPPQVPRAFEKCVDQQKHRRTERTEEYC